MSRLLIVLVIVALLATGGAIALDSATQDATNTTTVNNESFSPTNGINTLQHSNQEGAYYGASDTVTVYNNSSVVDPSGNYSWVQDNGTLDVVNNSYLSNRSSAAVSYEFQQPSESQLALVRLFAVFSGPVAEGLIIVLGLSLVLGALRAFGG